MLVRIYAGLYVAADLIAKVTSHYEDLSVVVTMKDGQTHMFYVSEARLAQRMYLRDTRITRSRSPAAENWTREDFFDSEVAAFITYANGDTPVYRSPENRRK